MTVAQIIEGRRRDLGGFLVRRLLPSPPLVMVGPFIFLDHFGPATFAPGSGLDVRPHPHINLATVTYLFAGDFVHRDSLGSEQLIRLGDVNWMTAGRGIVHSERTGAERRARGGDIHGLQIWVALPDAEEECEPSFVHHSAATLPRWQAAGATVRILAGTFGAHTSPVPTRSPLVYAHVDLDAGATFTARCDYPERAVYVVAGRIRCGASDEVPAQRLATLTPGGDLEVTALEPATLVFIGGAPVGPRHIEWNFISSRKGRIEEAKAAWRAGAFPTIPGDDREFIPLP